MHRNGVISCFAARSRDEGVLINSSSGGVFSELARYIVAQGGIAVGAGWDESACRVIHKCVESEKEIPAICGTKYVQSTIKTDIWRKIEVALQGDRYVLFSGTPCQTAAVRKRFGDIKRLVLCGLICHSNVPLTVWERYVSEIESGCASRLRSVKFRDKRFGWENSTMVFNFEDPLCNFTRSLYADAYGRAYLQGYTAAESCLNCQFKLKKSGADLIIGDFWGGAQVIPEWDDRKGMSAVVILNSGAAVLLERCNLDLKPVEYTSILKNNPYLEASITPDKEKRLRFQTVYSEKGIRKALHYAEFGPWPKQLVTVPCYCYKRSVTWSKLVAKFFLRKLFGYGKAK